MTPEQEKLVTDNHNLIYTMLQKYNLDRTDWYDIAAIGLVQAALTFDNSTKFSTYAGVCIKNILIREFRKNDCVKRLGNLYTDSLDMMMADELTMHEILGTETTRPENIIDGKVMYEKLCESLTEQERTVLDYRMIGYTYDEIGKKLKCSRQRIGKINDKIRIKYLMEFGGR